MKYFGGILLSLFAFFAFPHTVVKAGGEQNVRVRLSFATGQAEAVLNSSDPAREFLRQLPM